MPQIINYTTQIDVYKTIGEIQGILVDNGASKIMFEYDGKQPVSISFMISMPSAQDMKISLPARPKSVQKILEQMKREKGGNMKVKPNFEQACRVAWRIVKDWLEAQMAMVQTEQMEFAEIFLSSLLNNKGQRFYEIVKGNGFMLSEGRDAD
jgi:ornithine carbamoyltransferase